MSAPRTTDPADRIAELEARIEELEVAFKAQRLAVRFLLAAADPVALRAFLDSLTGRDSERPTEGPFGPIPTGEA